MSSYIDKCEQPIPIDKQKFAYQCENVVFEPIHGAISIRAFIPHNGGKEPYPNHEKDNIQHYELKIARFTSNSIEIVFTKKYKDKSEDIYLTSCSFAVLVNTLFEGGPANVYRHEAPKNNFQ